LLFNPGPAIEAASLIIKKIVPFWRSFIQGFGCQDHLSKLNLKVPIPNPDKPEKLEVN
jgi:hypothetical protein